jgi:uncharacterized membrane protein (DUF485 family)
VEIRLTHYLSHIAFSSYALPLLSYSVVRMIWWFLILGISTLVVVCVAIALYIRLRRHLQAAHAAQEGISNDTVAERQSRDIEQ